VNWIMLGMLSLRRDGSIQNLVKDEDRRFRGNQHLPSNLDFKSGEQ
jgi:hypothetical protein